MRIKMLEESTIKMVNDLNEYQKLADKTAKRDFGTREEEIYCWGIGLTGEAGDVASCIKKTFAHKKDVKDGIRENIGDMMWYAAMICNFFGWNFQEILDENIVKLKARYGEGFNYASVNRDMIKEWSVMEVGDGQENKEA